MKHFFTLIIILGFCLPVFADNTQPKQNVQLEKSYINKVSVCEEADVNLQNVIIKNSFLNGITVKTTKCQIVKEKETK